jgi:hypothetical protein
MARNSLSLNVIKDSFHGITLFRNDTRSFLKGKTIRKGPPKRKLVAYIMERLDDFEGVRKWCI